MKKTQEKFIRLRRYVWWLAAIWTLVISGSLVWNLFISNKENQKRALNTARLTIEKDILLRQWGAFHGGVYVPVTAATQPNPYLAQIPERDVYTPSGRLLTLLNPAYMTRQLYELAQKKKSGIQGRSTSLRPTNPRNAPDAWETQALKALEHGQAEVFLIADREGRPFIRLMRPYPTKKGCLKCHGRQVEKEGDLRGGISISIPLDTLATDSYQKLLIWLSHGFIWLLGLGLIGLGSCQINQDIREQVQIEEALRRSEEFARSIIENSPDCIKVLDLEGRLQFMSGAGQRLMQITNFAEYINLPYLDFFQGEDQQAARKALDQARQGETGVFQGYCPTLDSIPKWWDVLISPVFGSAGQVEALLAVSRDITAQKHIGNELAQYREHLEALVAERTAALQKANEELQQAHRDWEKIFQAIGHPTVILAPEHTVIAANRATLTALGKEAHEVIGEKCYELFHLSAHQPPEACPLEKLLQGGAAETAEMEIEAVDGTYLVSCTPVYDQNGRLEKIIHIATDITARKRAETALEESLSLYKAAIESTADGILVVNLEGQIVSWNRKFTDMWRIPLEVMAFRDNVTVWASILDQLQDPQGFLARITKIFQDSTLESCDLIPFKDGRVFERYSIPQYLNDRIVGRVLSFRDITERKKAEEKLLQEYAFRSAVIEQAAEGICVCHNIDEFPYVRFSLWNARMTEITGYTMEEINRRGWYQTVYPDPEVQIRAEERMARMRQGDDLLGEEWEIVRADGEKRCLRISTSIVKSIANVHHVLTIMDDITDRKRAEDALKESEEKYRLLVNQIPAVVFKGYADWSVDFYDRKIEELSGYRKEDFDSRQVKWCDLMPAKDLDYAKGVLIQALDTESKSFVREHRIRRKDGESRWIQCRGQAICDAKGEVDYISGVTFDITERKQAEEALRNQLYFLQTLIDTIPNPIFFKNVEGIYLGCNKALSDFLGLPKEEIIGKSAHDIYPKDLADRYFEMDSALFRQPGVQIYDFSMQHSDGTRHDVNFNKATYSTIDGTLAGLVGVMIDITERKRMEEALRASEARYRQIVETANEGIWSFDRDGRTIFINKIMAKWLGYAPEEILGRPIAEFLFAEDLADYHRKAEQRRQGENQVFERRYRRRDGSELPTIVSATAIMDDQGEYQGSFAMITDITARKQAEEAVQKTTQELQAIINSSPTAIISTAPDGKVTFWSPTAEKIFGWSAEEVLGKEMPIVPEGKEEEFRVNLQRILQGENLVAAEHTRRRKDGALIQVRVDAAALVDEHGRAYGAIGVLTDITEHKKAEEKYRTIVQTALDGFWLVDTQGRILEANQAYCKMSGYTQEELAQMTVAEIEAQMSPEKIAQEIQRVMETGGAAFESRHRGKDGRIFDVEVASRYLPHGEGGLFYAFLRDITERKAAEERYRTIIQTAMDGFWLVDTQGRIVEANEASWKMYGYTEEELLRLTLPEIEALESPEEIAQKIQRVMATGEAAFETRHRRKDGRIIDVEIAVCYLPQGEGGLFYAFMRNISERKRAEEQIRQSQLQLQAVFDGIPDPLLMVDRELRFKLLNRAALRYYQADSPESVVGKPCYQALKGLAAPCPGCEVPAAVSQGEFLLCERPGARDPARVEEVFVYPLPEAFGREGAAIIRISDITEARLIERHLLQSEKLASLGLLVAGIAHEINNPNSFITFNIPILRSYLQELLPVVDRHAQAHPDFAVCRMPYGEFRQDIFKLVDNLEHGSSRINTTVSALRDFARERGKGEITEFDLQKVIDRVVSICQGRIRKTAKTFTVEVPAGLPPMSGDPLALEQILVNLLINAAQALDKKDSWVTLKVARAEAGEADFIIEVSDNGCGMDGATRQRIFDPFFTTKPAGSGTGLGLSIVHRLVEELGGRVEVRSEPGQGATFRLLFSQ